MKINIFLQENLEALGKYSESTARWLARQNPDPDALYDRIFKNKRGLLDWKMDNGLGVMEILPPQALYKGWRPTEKVHGGATVIVGAGLGYGLNHVLAGTPNSHKVFIVEPRADILLACLGQTNYGPFMEIGKLRFLPPDPKALELAFRELDVSFMFSKINLRADMSLKQLGPEYERLNVVCRHKLESLSVELATLRHKQEIMVGNELHNFEQAMLDGSLLKMKNMARGVTAVILGAGPSLSQTLAELKKDRGYAVYATALQTLPALERQDFKPDVVLAIDFRIDLKRSIEALKDPNWAADIPFIYSTKMDPRVLELYPGPKIPLWTLGGVATFILSNQELVLDAGGNVGVTLERFFSWAGASRFILAGQDFAWPGLTTHAAGHHGAEIERREIPAAWRPIKNCDGETIYSNVGYLSAKRDLEKDIEESGLPFYNLYGGGAPIQGSQNISVEEARKQGLLTSAPGAVDVFSDALKRAMTPRTRPLFMRRAPEWSTSLRHAEKRLEKLFRKYAGNQGEIRKMFANVQVFLKQDPLYLPYLYNEIMDVAGLLQTRPKYNPKDLMRFKAIKKRVLGKVREMDGCLGR